jgi:hypothetical protein
VFINKNIDGILYSLGQLFIFYKTNLKMKKIILLSLALVAGLFVLSNVTNAQSVDSATVTLKINTNTGNTRCDFGENLYL